MKTVNDILRNKKQKEVWSVLPETTVFKALVLAMEKEISALMVIDETGKVAGIVSERNCVRKVTLKKKAYRDTAVKEIMTPADQMYKVKPEVSTDDCMVLMTRKDIKHLPVFDNDKLVGIISIGDLIKPIVVGRETPIGHLTNYGKYT